MKKGISFLFFLLFFFFLTGCTYDSIDKPSDTSVSYTDARSFEAALNEGQGVKGKIVQFCIEEYAPNSILGINCHAGDHLNFIFEDELNVEAGNTITVRITEEPSKIFLTVSWKVPCEFLSVVNNDNSNDVSSKGKIKLPYGLSKFKDEDVKEVAAELRNWGFTNITEVPVYDIYFGWTAEGSVEKVTINGNGDCQADESFDPNTPIIITYHLSVDSDPSKIKPPYDTDTAKGTNYEVVVQAFKDAGFTNIVTYERRESSFWGYEENTVANIYIDGNGTFETSKAFSPDAEVRIDYYVTIDSSVSTTQLSKYYAKKAFEEYGERIYPFGFKCHWILNQIHAEQDSEGVWFFKVGVTITTIYGTKIETIAEGMVSGSDSQPKVTQFYVSP